MDDKDTASAEKAFSEAVEAAHAGVKPTPVIETKDVPVPVKTASAKAKSAARKPAAKKAAASQKPAVASKAGAEKKPAPTKTDKPAVAAAKQRKRRAPTKRTTVTKPVKAKTPAVKSAPKEVEKTMASKTSKFDLMATLDEAKAKTEAAYQDAYKKGSEFYAESKEMTKANADALLASGRIVVEGIKSASSASANESREMMQTLGDDLKTIAAVKSPAELFELQGKLAARNYDATMAFASKSASSLKDFASKAFAPISAQAKANYEAVQKLAD
jgi:hypothetical protein